ncbi:GNAT family N-acetyltransferase [Nocardia sp. NPDC059240]|uniref:GNAT family N-acetyltransferase n=1 Tax=Nocardia sp. NPDC059240 TaxID=3346786 RepID=UPI0036CE0452
MPESTDFSIKPTLTGTTVLLRPFVPEDFEPMLAALRDPEVRRLTGSVHDDTIAPEDPDEVARLREWYSSRNAQPDRLDLAITELASGRCVGEAVLNQWDPGNRSCNFRILIGPDGQGRGLGTEATELLVGYGFEKLGLHRISLEVYAFNPRARRAYEKAGFRAEGVLRESLRYGEEWIDATVMSILEGDWARIHENRLRGDGFSA